ncbi:hypothetical protein Lal_00021288 [Lupinus albus]|nr:hypothetical protein Lal_00021288 [Lupinus albus]
MTLRSGKQTEVPTPRTDFFLNIDIDIDVPCTSLYTCHACTDSELCDSCIDEFLNIVVDSPVTHSHCTNTIDAGIRQQSDLFVQAPDWTPPFDLECDIAVYTLGTVLARHIWHQGHFGHYKWKMCAKVKIVFVFHLLPPPNSVLLLPPWKARSLVLNSFGNYQSWDPRLSERFSTGRERLTWEGEILGYTGGFSPERELARLGEKWHFGAVETVRFSLEREDQI